MSDLRFTEEHEWVLIEGDQATVGITDHAQEQLGEVVYVEVPETGKEFSRGDEAGVVESVKAASEIYAPLSGKILESNDTLADSPETVNEDPMGDAWFFKMSIADSSELEDLLSADDYKKLVEAGS